MDPNLVVRAQQGDQQAFETLAGAIHTRLYGTALGVLGDASSADDATQQALIGIWRYLPRLRDPSKFDGWSYRLLVRACYDEAKRRPDWLSEAAITPEREPVASDDYLGVARADQLDRALARISLDHRTVIVLRYMLDLPLEQVSEALEVSVSTVASRQARALAALRAAIEADARAPETVPKPEAVR